MMESYVSISRSKTEKVLLCERKMSGLKGSRVCVDMFRSKNAVSALLPLSKLSTTRVQYGCRVSVRYILPRRKNRALITVCILLIESPPLERQVPVFHPYTVLVRKPPLLEQFCVWASRGWRTSRAYNSTSTTSPFWRYVRVPQNVVR